MRGRGLAGALALLLAASAAAQQGTESPAPAEPEAPKWEFSASAYAYFVPHESDYVQPTLTADRGWLHLEGRYNYEAPKTASLWFGSTFQFGKTLTLELTPMVGGVFGKTNGVAPGYHLTLDYKKLELYSEGEYLFDTGNSADSYFYSWNELTYAPFDWLRAGLVSQRTRAYQTPLDIQRGFLVGGTVKNWKFTLYIFNAGWTDPTTVFSVSLDF